MSKDEVVRSLSQLLRALDADESLLSGPSNFMSRVVKTMLDIARSGPREARMSSAFRISEDESDVDLSTKHKSEVKSPFSASRQTLLSESINFITFINQFMKVTIPKTYKRSFASKPLTGTDRKKYLEYAWCLCYLDALHCRFCCFSLNLYSIFLDSFKNTTPMLVYSKDLIDIISTRDKQDVSFKKEIGKVALKLFKYNLVPHTSSKSSFVIKFTTAIMDEYFTQKPSITADNMLVNLKQRKIFSTQSPLLSNHYFNYDNSDFLSNIVVSLEDKLTDVNSFYAPFFGLYENNKQFRRVIDTFKNTLQASSFTPYSVCLNTEHFKLGLKVMKVQEVEKKERYLFFKELKYLQNIKDPYNTIVYPSEYTTSDYIERHLLVFYAHIQYSLEEIVFDKDSKRRYLFNEYEILAILFEVTKAVMFLHNNAITHTEITLDNIVFVDKKIKIICGNRNSDTKLFIKRIFKPELEAKTSTYDLFSLSMLLYFLLHSKAEVEDIVTEFLNLKSLAVIPSDIEVQHKWAQSIAKGMRPRIKDEEFIVDRPLRIELVSKMNNLWHEIPAARQESSELFRELNELINEYLESRQETENMLGFISSAILKKQVENKGMNEKFRKLNLSKNRQSIKKFRSVNNIHNHNHHTLKATSKLLQNKHLSKDSTMRTSAKNIFNFRGRKGKNTKQMLRPLSHSSDISLASKISVRRRTQDLNNSRVSRTSRRDGTKRDNAGRSVLYRIRKRKNPVEKKNVPELELELDDIQEIVKKNSSEEPYKNLLEEFEQEEVERHSRIIRSRNPSEEYLQEVFDDVESSKSKHSNVPPKILRLGKKKRGSFTKGFFTKRPDAESSDS